MRDVGTSDVETTVRFISFGMLVFGIYDVLYDAVVLGGTSAPEVGLVSVKEIGFAY
jgi:hypothetical protein